MASEFWVRVTGVSGNAVPLNPLLTFTPVRWSDMAPGGADSATVEVSGHPEALKDLVFWLGHGLHISSASVPDAWSGLINAIDLTLGPVTYSLSLDEVANRVQVLYSYEDVDGETISDTTAWAINQSSIDRYGYRELRHSESDLDEAQADALLARVLDDLALPSASVAIEDGDEFSAKISCVGLWHTLGLRYYANSVGREEHAEGSGNQPLGLGFESLYMGWADIHEKMHIYDHGAQFAEFSEGDRFHIDTPAVSGTFMGPYTAASGPSATSVTVVQADVDNEIIFEFPDEIISETGLMTDIRGEEYLLVENSSLNDRYHLVSSSDQNKMFTRESSTGNVVTEGGSSLITLTQGCVIEVEQAIGDDYGPGYLADPAAVTVYGIQIAQPFTNQSGGEYELAKVGISLWKVGSPTDNVTVKLCSNAAGVPSTTLATGTIAAADVRTVPGWVWAEMDTAVTLDETSTYFLVIQRAGDPDPADYFRVTVDDDGGYDSGAMLVHDGASSWKTSEADLCFKAWGAVETTEQIETMVDETGQFIEATAIRTASGIDSNQYRDGLLTALDEIEDLLVIGTSAGAGLNAYVTAQGSLVIEQVPASTSPLLALGTDGVLRNRFGGDMGPGRTVAGQWVEIDDAPGLNDAMMVVSPILVERSEYDARSGRLRTETAGTPDPWQIGEVVQG